ncbi:high affinity choline transporter 1 domain protein [Ancylostoma caninum]|uniref:High affinity choline transporter 1 domain protein n=1 Tax=Ancylostoma caninum TaxID=29170 RepID=A0A368F8U1_ANCCA|nr:high affinity choline transporter 1 domain protein [Ancylostoma caninum]
MSSADSSVLSAASMFAHNIWKLTIRPHASEREVILVMRFAIIAVGVMATVMALTIQSIYGLWYLCADLVYVILFPQLLCVVYYKNSNTYGLGAVSAAVMSSADSSVLSAASMFAHNIWKLTIRPHASEREVILVMRFAIIAVGVMATVMALTIQSIYGLWYLCADLVYVILFPQLLCVVYYKNSNTYGSLAGYTVGLILRLSGGEPLLGLPAAVHYPMYVDGIQYFPFKTAAMLLSLFTIMGASRLSEHLFTSGHLSPELDVLGCVVVPPERIPLPSDVSFNVSSDTLAMNKANGNGAHNATFTETSLLHPNYTDQNYLSTNSR